MTTIKQEIRDFFAALIERETGIVYGEVNAHSLDNRLHDVAKLLQFADVDAFWAEVKRDGVKAAAKSLLLDLATNNETSFFRDPEVFEFFQKAFVPNRPASSAPLRIWCAACSTGQEPYSLAMIMADLKTLGQGVPYQILATDFSERVLKQAAGGTFSQLEIQRGLPAAMMVRFFTQVTSSASTLPLYKIKPELSASITFKHLNLLTPWGSHGPFDIVFCRNVLIYQNVEMKKKVIARIAATLAPGGYLVLGGAESLLGLSSDFELERHGKACVYRVKAALKASA